MFQIHELDITSRWTFPPSTQHGYKAKTVYWPLLANWTSLYNIASSIPHNSVKHSVLKYSNLHNKKKDQPKQSLWKSLLVLCSGRINYCVLRTKKKDKKKGKQMGTNHLTASQKRKNLMLSKKHDNRGDSSISRLLCFVHTYMKKKKVRNVMCVCKYVA